MSRQTPLRPTRTPYHSQNTFLLQCYPKIKIKRKRTSSDLLFLIFGTAREKINDIEVLGRLVRLAGVWRDKDVESKRYMDVFTASPVRRISLASTVLMTNTNF